MRMDDTSAKTVGSWIADARDQLHGWRQEDLAAASRLSKSGLSNIERGKQGIKGWNPSTLSAIEDALRVPRGTLRRVAAGETVDPADVVLGHGDGQVLDEVRRLAAVVESLAERVDKLETRQQ